MEKKKITTDTEYARALIRIEQLMFNVLPCSPEGEELEALSKMVEEYENEHLIYVNDGASPYRHRTGGENNSTFSAKKKKPTND